MDLCIQGCYISEYGLGGGQQGRGVPPLTLAAWFPGCTWWVLWAQCAALDGPLALYSRAFLMLKFTIHSLSFHPYNNLLRWVSNVLLFHIADGGVGGSCGWETVTRLRSLRKSTAVMRFEPKISWPAIEAVYVYNLGCWLFCLQRIWNLLTA